MSKLNKIVQGVVTASVIFLIFNNVLADSPSLEKTLSVTVDRILAKQVNAEPASHQALLQCMKQYNPRLGSRVRVHYKIDTDETAAATYQGIQTQLYPLGIAGFYDFMSDEVAAPSGLQRIVFDMSRQFEAVSVHLIFINKYDPNTECIATGSLLGA